MNKKEHFGAVPIEKPPEKERIAYIDYKYILIRIYKINT
jgi:hypothetical protein